MSYKKHIRFDWAIKRLLRQKANFGILEGFLSELLKEDIKIIEILESEGNQETESDKYNRVDILVKDKKGDLIIIEVQNTYALDYFYRILYGVSKAITEHIELGDSYKSIKKVISVNIVYFELGQGSDYVYKGTTSFEGIHDHQKLELTPTQKQMFAKEKVEELYPEIYIIKVNKFDNIAKDKLDEWIYFLKNSEIKQEFSAKGIKKANKVLKVANMSDQERRDYLRFREVLSDRASIAMTIDFERERAERIAGEKAKAEAEKHAEIKYQQLVEESSEEIAQIKQSLEEISKQNEEASKQAEEASKQAEEAERKLIETIQNLLLLNSMNEKQIADITQVSVDFVQTVKDNM